MPLLILIGIVVGVILLVVLLNKLLHVLSIKGGWFYWPMTALFAVLFFFMALPGSPICMFSAKDYEDIFPAAWGVFFMHFLHAYFLIPMLDGETSVYFTYTAEYNDWTDTVTVTEHENEAYTPGWWKKLVAQAVIGFICFLVAWLSVFSLLWLILVVELIYSGYLSFIAIMRKVRK